MEMLGDRGGRGGIVVEPGAAPPARGGQAAKQAMLCVAIPSVLPADRRLTPSA